MSAAAQARRRDPELEIVALERGSHTSYSACGIPYVVGGVVDDLDDLVVRTPEQFRKDSIDVHVRHEVTGIDPTPVGSKRSTTPATARCRSASTSFMVGPPGPGGLIFGHGPAVRGASRPLDDGAALLDLVAATGCCDVVVVGGGYIGLEMAEAFVERGARVVLVDSSDHVMSTLDADMAGLVAEAITRFGVDLRTGVAVEGFEEGTVHTEAGELKADLVVLGLGVQPNAELAGAAGIDLGSSGAIAVDRRQRTSHDEVGRRRLRRVVPSGLATADPHGAGDGGQPSGPGRRHQHRRWLRHLPRRGRHGGDEDLLHRDRPHRAERAGGDGRRIRRGGGNGREHDARRLLPRTRPLTVKLVAERHRPAARRPDRRRGGRGKRIDVLAVAITSGMTVGEMINVDLSYAPPFSSVWDPVVVAARKAEGAVSAPR